MAYYNSPRTAPFGAITTLRAVTLFEHVLTAVKTWNDTRLTEAQLSRLSDRELRDIGLYRGQIGNVAHEVSRRLGHIPINGIPNGGLV